MAKVILRQKAIDDLNEIWDYTFEKWSAKQADKYYKTIKLICNGIGQNPEAGREYDGISTNLLGLKSEKHIIFYKVISDDRIEVVRILHERMDLKKRISE
jgi:toxin ParE1/3/4